ncbi:dual specificity protein phosphatase family protein [Paenibacillus sediminis]|uniref:Protein-tyrosine phosphatase n=1 Tax=Paenibacillus sediminis TaxID=664909 RepID=A0ABS4GY41_9BACL|nr:dual specificity protein phosphatase family protein [Paenibacillus sediminis]MBP1935171.1 protein-tyrosine phosphatase [Paenibacillus sediminis]
MTKIVEIIPDRLYAGGVLDLAGWSFIRKKADVVFNVIPIPDTPPFDPAGRMFIWLPLIDKVAPSLTWTIHAVKIMNELMTSGLVMYVHDKVGINRLGFILTAYFMFNYHLERDEALTYLRQKKPNLRPNAKYMQLLAEYEAYLKSHPN